MACNTARDTFAKSWQDRLREFTPECIVWASVGLHFEKLRGPCSGTLVEQRSAHCATCVSVGEKAQGHTVWTDVGQIPHPAGPRRREAASPGGDVDGHRARKYGVARQVCALGTYAEPKRAPIRCEVRFCSASTSPRMDFIAVVRREGFRPRHSQRCRPISFQKTRTSEGRQLPVGECCDGQDMRSPIWGASSTKSGRT